MIPIGNIQFTIRPEPGPDRGRTILTGRLELGHAVGFTSDEQKEFPGGADAFLAFKRNQIRRAFWQRLVGDLGDEVLEFRKIVRQHGAQLHTEDHKHIEAAVERILAHVEYDPAKMDEAIPEKKEKP